MDTEIKYQFTPHFDSSDKKWSIGASRVSFVPEDIISRQVDSLNRHGIDSREKYLEIRDEYFSKRSRRSIECFSAKTQCFYEMELEFLDKGNMSPEDEENIVARYRNKYPLDFP